MKTLRSSCTTLTIVNGLLYAAHSSFAQQQSQPSPCYRWSGQMAIASAPGTSSSSSSDSTSETLYYYGGQALTSTGTDQGNWTNALVSIDLSSDWPTGTPPLTLVEPDSGNYNPPAVSLGALWSSADGRYLYQYGGQFSDTPPVEPSEFNIFRYDTERGEWSIVETTGNDQVGRVAEGSATIVPGLGQGGENVGYYFSGHQDFLTTQGWSNQVARIYLNSLVEFDLGSLALRNITSYSSSASTSNTSTPLTTPLNRADGTLTYVPNLGTDSKGILVSIGGATNAQYVDNSVLDVYDIGAGGWTKQSTLGDTIGARVNHCAVRGSAKVHGVETHHIFVYGGQRLNQSDRDSSLSILTIQDNAYTWTFVGDDLSGQPAGRAGHQCAIKGDQLLVVGGLTSSDLLCDQPGIYVYNTTSSAWQSEYRSNGKFTTPTLLADVVGGIGTGTSTSGAGSASGGNGSQDPDTSGNTNSNSGSNSPSSSGGGGTNIGAIVGGVVGGIVALALIGLLLFLFLRKRRRDHEKNNVALGGTPERSDSGSSGGRFAAFPYEKRYDNPSGSFTAPYARRFSDSAASDDVEEETRGMEAVFNSSLVPRRELRVVNTDNDD